jgi:transposase
MSGLTPKQLQAVSEIAKGLTPSAISKDIGVSERTIQRWLKLPEFKAALAEIQERSTTKVIVEVSDDISARIQSVIPKAISTLESYIENPEARGSDRLRACHIIGAWAGLNQPQKQESQNPPEENLKNYLNYLATSTNGNSQSTHHS